MFADDKTLYACDKSPSVAADRVSAALSAISSHLPSYGLSVNAIKTVVMPISPPSLASSVQIDVSCDEKILKQVSSHKCLGLIVDSRLSWEEHVNSAVSKASQRIGCLWRIRRQISPKARRLFFLAVIQPCLEYCAAVFCTQISVAGRERVLAVFRRGIRAVCGAKPWESTQPLMVQLGIHALEDRWIIQLLSLGFRAIASSSPLVPLSVHAIFTPIHHSHLTRGQELKGVTLPQMKTKAGRNSFVNRVSILWNALPSALRSCSSLSQFKEKLKTSLSEPDSAPLHSSLLTLAFCPPSDL